MSQRAFSHYLLSLFVMGMYLFLYVPIIILVLFSFNNSLLPYEWKGLTFHWYDYLWQSAEIWQALTNSLIVAMASVALSISMGVALVYYSSRSALARSLVLFYGTLAVPEIVLSAGLLTIFLVGSVPLGLTTLIAAHTLLGLGYVVPIVHGRFQELDYALVEASLDLGATHTQTFFNVILPLLFPVITAAALLVFIISLDDFLLSFFCAGVSIQTLPMYIFSMIRAGATPMVNALSTVLLLVSGLLVLFFSSLKVKKTGFMP